MKILLILVKFTLILVILSVIGCFSKVSTYIKKPVTVDLSKYETVLVYVSDLGPGSVDVVRNIESKVSSEFYKERIFKNIFNYSVFPDTSADLRLNIKLLELKKGSFLSAFYGVGARLVVEVSIIDTKTEETLGVAQIKNSKKAGAQTTTEAINNVANAIVGFVKKAVSEK